MAPGREPASRLETASLYDRLSRWYDILGAPERGLRREALRELDARPGEAVLEVGFGTGEALLALARGVGPWGRVCGVDLSPGMAAVARRKLCRAGLAERVELTCGDALRLPGGGAAFDAVFMSFVLETLDDAAILELLGRCRRVLKPGGRLVAVSLAGADRPGPVARLYSWARRLAPRWIDCRFIALEAVLETGGFRVVRSRRGSLFGLPVAVARAEVAS